MGPAMELDRSSIGLNESTDSATTVLWCLVVSLAIFQRQYSRPVGRIIPRIAETMAL